MAVEWQWSGSGVERKCGAAVEWQWSGSGAERKCGAAVERKWSSSGAERKCGAAVERQWSGSGAEMLVTWQNRTKFPLFCPECSWNVFEFFESSVVFW